MNDSANGITPPVLSVVVPCHNEQDNVGPLLERLIPVLSGLESDFEVILVDDWSRDLPPRFMTRWIPWRADRESGMCSTTSEHSTGSNVSVSNELFVMSSPTKRTSGKRGMRCSRCARSMSAAVTSSNERCKACR